MTTTLLWLRQDLRLDDNPALCWAAARGAVVPVYIFDTTDPWSPGGASRWWLHHALQALQADLARHNVPLILRWGDPQQLLPQLATEAQAEAICWNRCYEPHAIARDTALKTALKESGLTVTTHNASLLFEPWEIKSQTGTPYRVFTPYYKACLALDKEQAAIDTPARLTGAQPLPSATLDDWQLLPRQPDWATGFDWDATPAGAHQHLQFLLQEVLPDYKAARDRPDKRGTSRLSPYLHFGQISPRTIWQTVQGAMQEQRPGVVHGGEAYLRELIWREFCIHLLYHQPHMPDTPLQPNFSRFPWRIDAAALRAWQKGATGYPIIDAGMRQLWQTGWMHNRVRMIVASFLVKDLLLPWQEGERWFWETLVDADLANNAAGWQWVAGCGADAAPYYRIFNPLLQSQKFDPEGAYIRRFVPELADLPLPYIHAPETAPPAILQAAGIRLGINYPLPMLDHRQAKDRALAALATIKGEN